MTIRAPQNIVDKLLAVFGKERKIVVPKDIDEKYGPYADIKAKRESFWKVLFGKKTKGVE